MNINKEYRLNSINNFIDNYIPNNIDNIIKNYSHELDNYKYIETLIDFSLLPLKGSLKYINKYDGKLRVGGLLIKIFKKNNKWYGIIKQISGKKYNVLFDSNHIFYKNSKSNSLRTWLDCFISEVDSGKYIIQ